MKFSQIPEKTFEQLQLNAGILLKEFTPDTGSFVNTDIIGATTGGVQFTDAPTYSDYGEDIDNAPKNTMELKRLDSHEVSLSGTYVSVDADAIASLMGAAVVEGTDVKHITPKNDLLPTDFQTIWWVGDYSDKNGDTNGGFIAIKLINALSTGGFQLKTGDKSKGNFAFEYTGHYSMSEQSKVPYEVYVKAGKAEA